MKAWAVWVPVWLELLVGAPASASAQLTPKIPRIGIVSGGTDPSGPPRPQWVAFFDELRALGDVVP